MIRAFGAKNLSEFSKKSFTTVAAEVTYFSGLYRGTTTATEITWFYFRCRGSAAVVPR